MKESAELLGLSKSSSATWGKIPTCPSLRPTVRFLSSSGGSEETAGDGRTQGGTLTPGPTEARQVTCVKETGSVRNMMGSLQIFKR